MAVKFVQFMIYYRVGGEGRFKGYSNIGIKKCTSIFVWVLSFGEVRELPQEFSNHYGRTTFTKMVSNFRVVEGIFGTKILCGFFYSEQLLMNFQL